MRVLIVEDERSLREAPVDLLTKHGFSVETVADGVTGAPEADGVAITVTDRGPGVAEEWIREPRAFRRGSSSLAPGGLGLGLFLVHRIVHGHGGAIHSTAAEGGGASVRVFLPAFYKA